MRSRWMIAASASNTNLLPLARKGRRKRFVSVAEGAFAFLVFLGSGYV